MWVQATIGVTIGQIHSQPQGGDKSAMRPFVVLLWTLSVLRCNFVVRLSLMINTKLINRDVDGTR